MAQDKNFKCGPSGGGGGDEFVDANTTGKMVKVSIWHGASIDAIQTYTGSSGKPNQNTKHGGSGGSETDIQLDADEYLIEVSGSYSSVVDTITLRTNKSTYGPYGTPKGGRNFLYQVPIGWQINGFAGCAGDRVDSIGTIVNMQ